MSEVTAVLHAIMIDFDPPHVDRSVEDIGKEFVSTIRWVDENTFLKRLADGSELAFLRCLERK